MDKPHIPSSFKHLLAAWNEPVVENIQAHLSKAVSEDIVFVDPNYAISGMRAFETMVRMFRTNAPDARCIRTSEIDMHHDRARYSWTVIVDEENRVDGFDAVQVNADGLICRVDGFFGPLELLQQNES
jgi:SnoaL-like domain